MRWFWIDQYTEFESGRHATATKSVTLAEDHLHDHFPGAPVMPNSLVLEGMAQTAGLLVSQQNNFETDVVLAKVARIAFRFDATPGSTLVYRAKIEYVNYDGALVTVTSHVGERLQAEAEIFFAHLEPDPTRPKLFDGNDLMVWLRLLKVFEVGRNPDGSALQPPDRLLRDEEAACSVALSGP